MSDGIILRQGINSTSDNNEIQGNLNINNNTNVGGIISGDGSGLTNLPISATTNLQINLGNKVETTLFNTYTGNTENVLRTKVSTASNIGGGEGLFSGKSVNDLQFKSLTSTGNTITISTTGATVNLEASDLGYITASSTDTLTNKSGNITQWTQNWEEVEIKGDSSTNAGKLRINCYNNNHYVDIKGPDHTNNPASYDIQLPNKIATQTAYSSNGRILEIDANGNGQWINTPSGGSGGVTATNGLGNRIAVFDSTTSIEGDGDFTWNGSSLYATNTAGTSFSRIFNNGRLTLTNFSNELDIQSSYGNVNWGSISHTGSLRITTGGNSSKMVFMDTTGSVSIGKDYGFNSSVSARLNIKGAGNDSSTTALCITNSDDTNLFKVLNDGTVVMPNIGGTPSVTNLGVDASGNVVSGTTGGSGGFTISATDNQIPYVDGTNSAFEYVNNFTYNGTTLTVIGGSTNDVLINTYTTGQSSGTDAQTFSVKSRGDLSGAINGKAWKLSRFSSSSVLFGSTSNHPLSIGAGTDIGGSNKTGGHMHINPNGNITIGDDTFNSADSTNGFSNGARLYVKSDTSGTNLELVSNSDVSLFKVLNDGTINIPSTSIKATAADTLLAVDSSGNIVDGSSLAGSGGGGGSVTYGTTSQIPFMNSSSNGFEYTNSTNAGYNGRFEWQNEMLEVNSGFGTSVPSASIGSLTASDYTARFRKSYTYSQPYTSLGIRRDGTVEIGQHNQNSYQNVLSFHQMNATAISNMKDDQYFNKLYVNSLSELRYRTSGGIESILNLLFAADGAPGMQKRVQVRGSTSDNKRHNFEIVSGSNANANDWGTKLKTQKANLIVSYPSNIGSDTYNTTLNSTSILGGTMDVATHTTVSSSVIGGYNHKIDGGNYHTVFGSGNKVYNENRGYTTTDSSTTAVLIGGSNRTTGDQNIAIGHNINIQDGGSIGGRIDESAGFGHDLFIYNSYSYAIGNGHYGGYIPGNVASISFNLQGVTSGGGAPTAGFFNFRNGADHDDAIIGEPVNFSMGSSSAMNGVIKKETNGSTGDSVGRGVFWLSSANSTVAPNVKPADAVGTYASNRAGSLTSMGKMIYAEQGNTWIGDRIGINVHDDTSKTTYLTTEEDIDSSLHIFTESNTSTDNAILVEEYVSGSANNFKYKVRNDGVVVYPQFSKTNLPTGEVAAQIWVTDDVGGACMAVYNGTNWVRIYDNATIS